MTSGHLAASGCLAHSSRSRANCLAHRSVQYDASRASQISSELLDFGRCSRLLKGLSPNRRVNSASETIGAHRPSSIREVEQRAAVVTAGNTLHDAFRE